MEQYGHARHLESIVNKFCSAVNVALNHNTLQFQTPLEHPERLRDFQDAMNMVKSLAYKAKIQVDNVMRTQYKWKRKPLTCLMASVGGMFVVFDYLERTFFTVREGKLFLEGHFVPMTSQLAEQHLRSIAAVYTIVPITTTLPSSVKRSAKKHKVHPVCPTTTSAWVPKAMFAATLNAMRPDPEFRYRLALHGLIDISRDDDEAELKDKEEKTIFQKPPIMPPPQPPPKPEPVSPVPFPPLTSRFHKSDVVSLTNYGLQSPIHTVIINVQNNPFKGVNWQEQPRPSCVDESRLVMPCLKCDHLYLTWSRDGFDTYIYTCEEHLVPHHEASTEVIQMVWDCYLGSKLPPRTESSLQDYRYWSELKAPPGRKGPRYVVWRDIFIPRKALKKRQREERK